MKRKAGERLAEGEQPEIDRMFIEDEIRLAAEDEERARLAEARRVADEIKHGVTPSQPTVPTQIRILQSQLDDLKVISGIERANVSSILRVLIAEYISEKRKDEHIAQALDWAAGGRRVMEKARADREGSKKHSGTD